MIQSVVGHQPLTAEGLFEWIAVVQKQGGSGHSRSSTSHRIPDQHHASTTCATPADDEMYVTTHDLQT